MKDTVAERIRIGNTPTCEDCDQPLEQCICEENELVQMEALNQAVTILNKARREASTGSLTIWRMIDHAASHLDAQISEMRGR